MSHVPLTRPGRAARGEKAGQLPRSFFEQPGRLGLSGTAIPEEYGGGGGRTTATTWSSRRRPARSSPWVRPVPNSTSHSPASWPTRSRAPARPLDATATPTP
ncbi:acyl-CoA dehydrogenase family protein [Streptomyces niveiscabiei]|uniref:acyl-CoA dehydrogenase family protein n=1 Tax=Streptomyces niveiscabiei TaxID=164115 RepID=UPI00389AE1EE